MSKISELTDGGSLLPTDTLIAVRSGANVKVVNDTINVTTLNPDQINMGDNEQIRLGNSQDLLIYHDGTNSLINDAGSGSLQLQQGGSTKLEVTTTGIDVTGTVTADGLTISKNGATTVTFGEQGGGDTTTLNLGKGFDSESAIWFKGSSNWGGLVMPGNENIVISLDEDDAVVADRSFLVQGSGRTKTHLSVEESGDISFYEDTGTTAKFFWDASAESLGIGASPSYQLDVIGTTEKLYARIGDSTNNSFTTTTPVLRLSGDSANNNAGPGLSFYAGVTTAEIYGTRQGAGSDGDLRFHTRISGTVAERMRIDDDGALLVGTTTTFPGSVTNVAGMHFGGTTPGRGYFSNDGGRALNLNRMTSDGDIIEFRKDGTSVGSIGASGGTIYAGKGGSGLIFNDGGTKDLIPYSLTAADTVDNSISLGISSKRFKDLYLSGGLRGDTTFSNNAGTTEYARFDSSGNLLVGRSDVFTFSTNTTDGVVLSPSRIDVSAASLCRISQVRDSTGTYDRFYNSSNIVGSITCTTSATAYNTSSDQRLKDNIVDAPSASDDIDAIQVRSFDWKVDGSHQKYGMVAQELVTVAPEAVSQPEDPEEMMGVDYSKLVPMLIKEVQQLRARVAQLEGAN
jgi:hypothetical protein